MEKAPQRKTSYLLKEEGWGGQEIGVMELYRSAFKILIYNPIGKGHRHRGKGNINMDQ